MNSREKILMAVRKSQPAVMPLPDVEELRKEGPGQVDQFTQLLTGIGGRVWPVSGEAAIRQLVTAEFANKGRIVSTVPFLQDITDNSWQTDDPHQLADVAHAVIEAELGVAENGAVWITEETLGKRVLPFICENVVVILHQKNIVPSMHDAYALIDRQAYGFGVFIAGPSKTADIEQSLVLGAHGPKSMHILLRSDD